MAHTNRRLGVRISLETLLTLYINDEPFRALTTNLSESGVFVNLLRGAPFCRDTALLGVELTLPGMKDAFWARGHKRHHRNDQYFHGIGVQFTAMPTRDARAIRDYCHEQHQYSTRSMRVRIPSLQRAAA